MLAPVLFAPQPIALSFFAIGWLFRLFLLVVTIVLAVRAARGHDVDDSFLPKLLVDRLPAV